MVFTVDAALNVTPDVVPAGTDGGTVTNAVRVIVDPTGASPSEVYNTILSIAQGIKDKNYVAIPPA